jgi:hypothetical protein
MPEDPYEDPYAGDPREAFHRVMNTVPWPAAGLMTADEES